jgi:hypothetical protein
LSFSTLSVALGSDFYFPFGYPTYPEFLFNILGFAYMLGDPWFSM